MKSIQLIDSLIPGGAEVIAVNIANGLVKEGIESHFCTTRKEGLLKKNIREDVNYLFLGRKKTLDIRAILKFKKYLKKHNITIIHAHTTSSFFGFCIKLIYPKIFLIWHNHTGAYINLKGKKKWMLKAYSKHIDYIISVNRELELWSENVLRHKRGSYIANFPVFTNKEEITNLFGKQNKRIVCLAGLRDEKDHLNLLNAFLELKKSFPDWTLHLIGKDYENSYSEIIKEYISNNNLLKNVFLYGVCSDIKNILDQATIGVLSSKSEGLPISLLEYGLAGLPVVVTDVGDCNQLVKDKKFVVNPNNPLMLASALKVLMESKEIRKQAGESLHNLVLNDYSQERALKKMVKIYSRLC